MSIRLPNLYEFREEQPLNAERPIEEADVALTLARLVQSLKHCEGIERTPFRDADFSDVHPEKHEFGRTFKLVGSSMDVIAVFFENEVLRALTAYVFPPYDMEAGIFTSPFMAFMDSDVTEAEYSPPLSFISYVIPPTVAVSASKSSEMPTTETVSIDISRMAKAMPVVFAFILYLRALCRHRNCVKRGLDEVSIMLQVRFIDSIFWKGIKHAI